MSVHQVCANKPTANCLQYFLIPKYKKKTLSKFTFICVCMRVTSPGQTKNETDLKFGPHTPIDLI